MSEAEIRQSHEGRKAFLKSRDLQTCVRVRPATTRVGSYSILVLVDSRIIVYLIVIFT